MYHNVFLKSKFKHHCIKAPIIFQQIIQLLVQITITKQYVFNPQPLTVPEILSDKQVELQNSYKAFS